MKLSEINELGADAKCGDYFNVEVDEAIIIPPPFLQGISVIAKMDGDTLESDLIDVIISYATHGIELVLDVPAELDVDIQYLIHIAANAKISISFLPPKDLEDKELMEKYCDRLYVASKIICGQRNFTKMAYPINNHLEYLYLNAVSGIDAMSATDDYTKQSFISKLPLETVDHIKSYIKKGVFEFFGGEDEFTEFAKTLINKVVEESAEEVKEFSDNQKVYFEKLAEELGRPVEEITTEYFKNFLEWDSQVEKLEEHGMPYDEAKAQVCAEWDKEGKGGYRYALGKEPSK